MTLFTFNTALPWQEIESREIHLLEVNAATAIRVVEPESPGELLIVGSLPADAHGQQPLPGNEEKGTKAFSMEKARRGPPKAYCPAVVCVQRIEYQLLHLLCLPEKRRGRCIKFVWSITQFLQKASQNIACDIYPCWPPRLGWSLWSCCTTPVIFHPWAARSAQGQYLRPTSTWALSIIECFSRK